MPLPAFPKVRPAPVLLALALLAVPAQADLLGTNWSMTADEVAAADPSVTVIDEPITSDTGRVYKLLRSARLGEEHRFTAHYFFRQTDDLLDLIVLELKAGSPGTLFEIYDQAYGPGTVLEEPAVVRNRVVHEVQFVDRAKNNVITYDRRGDDCKLIFTPRVRGQPSDLD